MVMANAARHTGGVKQKHNKFHVFHFLLNGGGDVWPLGFDLSWWPSKERKNVA